MFRCVCVCVRVILCIITVHNVRPMHLNVELMTSKVLSAQINGNTAKSRMKEIINKQKKTGDEFFSKFASSYVVMLILLLLLLL